MKTKKLLGLTPEEVEYLRKIRGIHGLWIDRSSDTIIAGRGAEAEYFFKEVSILDSILSS